MTHENDWQEVTEWRHKHVCASVYAYGDIWRYEYENEYTVNQGSAATREVAMQRIADYLAVGIEIKRRVK